MSAAFCLAAASADSGSPAKRLESEVIFSHALVASRQFSEYFWVMAARRFWISAARFFCGAGRSAPCSRKSARVSAIERCLVGLSCSMAALVPKDLRVAQSASLRGIFA